MKSFENVFISGVGHYLPGPKINNDEMDEFIGLVNKQSARIKKKILAENGIISRHYGIKSDGSSRHSMAEMGAEATRRALQNANLEVSDIDFLATGTVSGDVIVPGFSNMLQAELEAPPLETLSINGICASGMSAFKMAAQQIDRGDSKVAAVNASEFPSRMFKKCRFERSNEVDFGSHFLRWMLSDGSGTFVLTDKPRSSLSLKVKWIHNKSFSGDFPTCMAIGFDKTNTGKSYLDLESMTQAEEQSHFFLRQDIRLLPNIFEVGFSEYLSLIEKKVFNPMKVDHFLAHYSSEKFSGTIKELMRKSDVFIPEDRWFSNLTTSGNMGAASIFVMLSEFLAQKNVKAGEQILMFVPESGRFSVSFAMLEVVGPSTIEVKDSAPPLPQKIENSFPELFLKLSDVWSNYRSDVLRTPLAKKIFDRSITPEDYKLWISHWVPQVREGAVWMRNGIQNLPSELSSLGNLIETHATEEQFDFKILYKDYQNLGGQLGLEDMSRTPGGDALNAYMLSQGKVDPLALLGGIFIIEGTGQKIIPTLLPFMKDALGENLEIFKFLQYHGENDQNHLERWANAVEMAINYFPNSSTEIIRCAKKVATLYLMQWQEISDKLEETK